MNILYHRYIKPSFTELNFLFLLHFPLHHPIYLHDISHVISMPVVLIFFPFASTVLFIILTATNFSLHHPSHFTSVSVCLSVLSTSLRQLSRSYDGFYWSIIFALWRHFRSNDHVLTGSLLKVGHYTRRKQQLLQDGTWCLLELFVDSNGMFGRLCFLVSRKKMWSIWKNLRLWNLHM